MIGLKVEKKAFPRGFDKRHLNILRLLAKGHDQYSIAKETGFALSTVKSYRFHMLKVLGVNKTTHAIAIGFANGWLEEDTEEAA